MLRHWSQYQRDLGCASVQPRRMHQGRFSLDIRENSFPEGVQHRLPRTVVESPSMEALKSFVDVALGAVG